MGLMPGTVPSAGGTQASEEEHLPPLEGKTEQQTGHQRRYTAPTLLSLWISFSWYSRCRVSGLS